MSRLLFYILRSQKKSLVWWVQYAYGGEYHGGKFISHPSAKDWLNGHIRKSTHLKASKDFGKKCKIVEQYNV